MNKDKENAFSDFIDMIKLSWTYERLTETEREKALEALKDTTRRALIGSYKQRFEILNAVYHGFLLAIGYEPIGWRETDPDAPLF